MTTWCELTSLQIICWKVIILYDVSKCWRSWHFVCAPTCHARNVLVQTCHVPILFHKDVWKFDSTESIVLQNIYIYIFEVLKSLHAKDICWLQCNEYAAKIFSTTCSTKHLQTFFLKSNLKSVVYNISKYQ